MGSLHTRILWSLHKCSYATQSGHCLSLVKCNTQHNVALATGKHQVFETIEKFLFFFCSFHFLLFELQIFILMRYHLFTLLDLSIFYLQLLENKHLGVFSPFFCWMKFKDFYCWQDSREKFWHHVYNCRLIEASQFTYKEDELLIAYCTCLFVMDLAFSVNREPVCCELETTYLIANGKYGLASSLKTQQNWYQTSFNR